MSYTDGGWRGNHGSRSYLDRYGLAPTAACITHVTGRDRGADVPDALRAGAVTARTVPSPRELVRPAAAPRPRPDTDRRAVS